MSPLHAMALLASTTRAKLSSRHATQAAAPTIDPSPAGFQLCFRSLFQSGPGFAFPCDDKGQVSLDAMSERARNNYFYARAMVGRELTPPAVEPLANH
jgi:hypothetical protein